MKSIFKYLLNKLGYKIERNNNPNPLQKKYNNLIEDCYQIYAKTIFNTNNEINSKTIELIANLDGTQVSEAIYIINYLEKVKLIKGDICEFGVAQGYTSALMAYQILDNTKNIWLFDSFKGLPKPTDKDFLKDDIFNLGSIEAYQGLMAHDSSSVINKIKNINFPLERVKIIHGFIEDTIKLSYLPNSVSFAYVDFDFYEPIKIALEYLHETLTIGGVIIVDDYNFFSTGAKTAVDEFYHKYSDSYSLEFPLTNLNFFCVLLKIK